MRSHTATVALGLLASIAVSVVAWWYFGTLLFFLLIPFVPFLFRTTSNQTTRECPRCGYETTSPEYEFCPRDGERLREEDRVDQHWEESAGEEDNDKRDRWQ